MTQRKRGDGQHPDLTEKTTSAEIHLKMHKGESQGKAVPGRGTGNAKAWWWVHACRAQGTAGDEEGPGKRRRRGCGADPTGQGGF